MGLHCRCGLDTVSGPCFLAPDNMCAPENLPTRLQLTLHTHTHRVTQRPGSPPLQIPLAETHRDRSLIHIFLLGADFSSKGDGQSDSSISGGLRGDSSMLSHCLGNRRRRQPLCSALAPWPFVEGPSPLILDPSYLLLAWTSQAGVSGLSPS